MSVNCVKSGCSSYGGSDEKSHYRANEYSNIDQRDPWLIINVKLFEC